MTHTQQKRALTAAVNAARAAGKIMRDNWHLPKRVNSAVAHDIKLELDVQCQALIDLSVHAGGLDNATAVMAQYSIPKP